MKINSVCVVGLGTVGKPTAEYFASRGVSTYGYDLSEKALRAARGSLAAVATRVTDLPKADLYIIAVQTGLRSERPNVENVLDACRSIASIRSPELVSIESTVPVGTCERIYNEILCGGNLVHIPHRYWAADPVNYGVAQPRIVGSITPRGLKLSLDFYRRHGIPLVPVPDIRIAELCKIAENTDRYLKIAYAELLRLVCLRNGLDFDELRRAMNTKWNVGLLEAREGIGGTCLPKDIRYLRSFAPDLCRMLDEAIRVDDAYRTFIRKRRT